MRRARLAVLLIASCGGADHPAASSPSQVVWLQGSWIGERGAVAEHWTATTDRLVGVGFGVVDGVTRSYEIMTIAPGPGGALAFTARPQGSAPVVFPQEASGDGWVVFANPQHDYPQKVAYRTSDGRLVAHVEGRGKSQDWMLDRRPGARSSELERAAVDATGEKPITSALSPARDVGFTLSPSRLTIWRLRTTWVSDTHLDLKRAP